MPGNEFGERIHNFFGQEGLPHDQHQSQVVDGSWSGFSNGLVGNQRQFDPSLIANLKNYSTQQSVDPVRGQSSNAQHGLNFTPQSSEYPRNQFQEHQQHTNGYLHGNLMLQASPNEANFLGMDAEASRDRLSVRGFPPDQHKTPMRFEMGESPVNYDFFGGQQQLNSQLPGMVQPLPRQQMTFNDMQLLKQQVMVKQMHDYQMQQQLQKQHLEARHLNSLNSNAVNGNRSSDNQSHPLINGIPLQDASSHSWQPDLMTGNTNWMHRGMSPVVQGSSSGHMITPEQGQANLMAQQFEPSLYGMPVSGTNAPQNAFSSVQMNRLAAQHGSANRSSSLTNQPTTFLNQGDVQDNHMLPSSRYQEQPLFSHSSVPSSNDRPNVESLQVDDSRDPNISVQEKFGHMESSGPSEKPFMKVPENMNALQKSTALDPTEEKFLFGSDDNLWAAFGNSTDVSLTGNLVSSSSDLFDACPSLQSGSWSALMQSAVAETSSEVPSAHEWGNKQKSVWGNNGSTTHANSHIGNRAQDSRLKASNTLSERVHSDSTQTAVQHLQDTVKKVPDHVLLEKPMAQHGQVAGNIFHSSSSSINGLNNSSSIQKNEGTEDRLGIWKAASNQNLAALKEQKNHFTQNLQMQKGYGSGIAGDENDSSASRDVQGNIQQHLDSNSVCMANPQLKSRGGSQILESYAGSNAGSNEMVNARDLSMLPGGKETQSGQTPRRFQYHPMGNIDVTNEPYREKVSQFGQSRYIGQPAMNMKTDKGHVSENDLNCTNEAFKGTGSESSRSTSASADRSVDRCNQVKSASSRQTMLELLHKVDQSEEHSLETNVTGIPEAKTSAEYGVQFRHNQSSASQGFSLQLAPPSQPAHSPDNVQFSQNSLQPLNSVHTVPEKGGTSQSRFAPWATNHTLPQQSTHQGPFPGIPGETNITSSFPYSTGYHQNQPIPVAARQTANHSVNLSSELSTSQVRERNAFGDIDQRGLSAQTPSLQHPTLSASRSMVASSSSQQNSPSGMTYGSQAGISAPQHRFWNQQSKPWPDIIRSHQLPSNNVEGSFSRQEKTNHISSQNGGSVSLHGTDMVNITGSQNKDIGAKPTPDVDSVFSKLVQSNLHTLDRSLVSKLSKDNLRYNEHMSGSGTGEGNLSQMNNAVDPQKLALKAGQQSPSTSDGLVRDGLNHKESANHMLRFGQTVSQNFSNKNHAASAVADHKQISPQMAPSWYSQYGTFKNGLVQPVSDTGRFTPLKIGEQSSISGSLVDGTHSVQSLKQFDMQQLSSPAAGADTPLSESLPHAATDQLPKVDKPKKRKTATSELLSWNKEVTQAPQRLQTLGEAEVDWVRATNRYAEKVEFETSNEYGPPARAKRRLIYTTQLVQQLFRPPPVGVISSVASSNYEFVAYTAARAALGDACSSTSTDITESFLAPNDSILLSERTKTENINDQHISKAAEDFISRTRKLESDFAGLENGSTIADLRVEVQDLEKYAVINRFARFHPASSSMDGTVSSLRLNPQRYVAVAPTPQNIPDRVQCLAL